MAKLRGVLKHSSLEGGLYVFEAEDGQQYQLEALPANLQTEGGKLELEGSVQKDLATIGMVGPVFRVASAQSL